MNKETLLEYKRQLSLLSEKEKKERDLYLRDIASGEIMGPSTGYPSIDKRHLKNFSKEVIMGDIPKMNALEYLMQCNKNNGKNIALYPNVTYEEMIQKIDEVADSLHTMGIRKGDIIASCLPSVNEAIYLIYGAAKIGAIIDLIDLMSSESMLAKYCDISKPKILFTLDVMCKNAISIMPNSSYDYVVTVPTGMNINMDVKNVLTWQQFVSEKNEKANWCTYEENMPFAILHTGGTTGVPKGALISHDNANSLAYQVKNTSLDMRPGETALNLMPPFASYGFGQGIHVHLCAGLELIQIPTYEPHKIAEQILTFKPNRIACSPAHYEYILNSPELQNADLSFLHHPIEGGDTLDLKTEQKVNELLLKNGCRDKVAKGYGLTETCAGICICTNNEVNKLLSVGTPLVKNVISIFDIDDENRELQYGEEGEIAVLSPNNMLGYYNNDEETKAMIKEHADGAMWLHTGDLGKIDKDGILFITGRLRRMIIQFAGLKANPFEVEEQLIKHPLVKRAVVVGTKDPEHERGELPVAYIVIDEENMDKTEELKQELHRICEETVTYYSVPIDYVFVRELPKTNRGKVDIIELSRQYNEMAHTRNKILQKELKF